MNYNTKNCNYEFKPKLVLEVLREEHALRKIDSEKEVAKTKVRGRTYEEKIDNLFKRKFKNQPYRNVVINDLTYIRVRDRWEYICILVDLFNREIIGYSDSRHKNLKLVKQAFAMVNGNLRDIEIFHTYKCNEFKNKIIDETMEAFHIKH